MRGYFVNALFLPQQKNVIGKISIENWRIEHEIE
jgi:hypothetical protein